MGAGRRHRCPGVNELHDRERERVQLDRHRHVRRGIAATLTSAGISQSIGTAALVASNSSIVGAGTTIATGTGALPSAVCSLAGAGIVETIGSGALVANIANVAGSVATVGTGALAPTPIEKPILEGAIAYVNFLTNKGYVAGVGDVPIATLIGSDPDVYDWHGETDYYPAGHTALGYEYTKAPPAFLNNKPPALLGVFKDAALSGKTIVIRSQSDGSSYSDFNFGMSNIAQSAQCYIRSTGEDDLTIWATIATGKLLDGWAAAPLLGSINAVAFHVIPSNRVDLGSNSLVPFSLPITDVDTPPGEPFNGAVLYSWGPLLSIAAYDTLPLAELRAKTIPEIDPLVAGSRLHAVGGTAQSRVVISWFELQTVEGALLDWRRSSLRRPACSRLSVTPVRQALALLQTTDATASGAGTALNVFATLSLAVTAPSIGAPALKHTLAAIDLVAPAPVIGTPTSRSRSQPSAWRQCRRSVPARSSSCTSSAAPRSLFCRQSTARW